MLVNDSYQAVRLAVQLGNDSCFLKRVSEHSCVTGAARMTSGGGLA